MKYLKLAIFLFNQHTLDLVASSQTHRSNSKTNHMWMFCYFYTIFFIYPFECNMIDILVYDMMKINIFMYDPMKTSILIYDVRSHVHQYKLSNADNYPWTIIINVYDKDIKWDMMLHEFSGKYFSQKYCLETTWTIIWPNKSLLNKRYIPTERVSVPLIQT